MHPPALQDPRRAYQRHPQCRGVCRQRGRHRQPIPRRLELGHEGFARLCLPADGRTVRHVHTPLHAARHAGHHESTAGGGIHAQDGAPLSRQALRLPCPQRLRHGSEQLPGGSPQRRARTARHRQRTGRTVRKRASGKRAGHPEGPLQRPDEHQGRAAQRHQPAGRGLQRHRRGTQPAHRGRECLHAGGGSPRRRRQQGQPLLQRPGARTLRAAARVRLGQELRTCQHRQEPGRTRTGTHPRPAAPRDAAHHRAGRQERARHPGRPALHRQRRAQALRRRRPRKAYQLCCLHLLRTQARCQPACRNQW